VNRAERRRAERAARKGDWRIAPTDRPPVPGEIVPLDRLDCVCDGMPCPYCGDLTAENELGVYVCTCGWSGAFVYLPPKP
jgi:hypothetical protein